MGISAQEKNEIMALLGREPNELELAIYSVMWSEHCSYKSSLPYIKQFFDRDKGVVKCGEENAGGIRVSDKYALIFKVESHNHPTAIEPYEGASTGVGGILRDIFAMGATPIALLDSLHFGPIESPKTRYYLDGVVRGISFYANCVGVPTVGGETIFHNSYHNNPLVNVMALGIVEPKKLLTGRFLEENSLIILAGSKTGRDGIRGAEFASRELEEKSKDADRLSVQIGDPLLEKLIMDLTLELNERGLILTAQDLGAGGISAAVAEMVAKADAGVIIDLHKIHLREKDLTPIEIMLSESQERIAFAASPEKLCDISEVANKYGVEISVIGNVLAEKYFVVRAGRDSLASIPIESLIRGKGAPVINRPYRKPKSQISHNTVPEPDNPLEFFVRFADDPNVVSKQWIYEQYDQTIGTNTIVPAGSGASLIRIKGEETYIALSIDSSAFYTSLDPFEGGKSAIAEGIRNITALGGTPIAITDCLNFPSPEEPEKFYYFVRCVEGIKVASETLDIPIVSGNVSFYNESENSSILPTPVVGTVGIINYLPFFPFCEEGDLIIVVGETKNELCGTIYQLLLTGELSGSPPRLDLETEKRNAVFVREIIKNRLPGYVADLSSGGVCKALLNFALKDPACPYGVSIECPHSLSPFVLLFSESQSRYLVIISESRLGEFDWLSENFGVPYTIIGKLKGDSFEVKGLFSIKLDRLNFLNKIREIMGV